MSAVSEVWTRRRTAPTRLALTLFVGQQVLATVWPLVSFSGYGWLGLAGLWITVAVLLAMDLLLAGAAALLWEASRRAGVVLALDLLLALFVTALIIGSAGQHAVLWRPPPTTGSSSVPSPSRCFRDEGLGGGARPGLDGTVHGWSGASSAGARG